MNIEAMLQSIEQADEDVRRAEKERADLKAHIIKEMVRDNVYDFLSINISKMRQVTRRMDRVRR
jgi:hypothetical protein